MAWAIMGGLLVATLLTLLFLPALYAMCYGASRQPVATAESTVTSSSGALACAA
jgi:Cation/multidrug efflux pump